MAELNPGQVGGPGGFMMSKDSKEPSQGPE